MTMVSDGCVAMAVGWIAFVIVLVLPAADRCDRIRVDPDLARDRRDLWRPGALAAWWPGARSSAGFWLVVAILGLLVELMNAPYIPPTLAHPADTNSFLIRITVVVGGAAVMIGGIAAFLDVRRGTPTWSRTGRTVLVVRRCRRFAGRGHDLSAGRLVGQQRSHGRSADGERSAHRREHQIRQVDLSMRKSDVLGLFVINGDAIGH